MVISIANKRKNLTFQPCNFTTRIFFTNSSVHQTSSVSLMNSLQLLIRDSLAYCYRATVTVVKQVGWVMPYRQAQIVVWETSHSEGDMKQNQLLLAVDWLIHWRLMFLIRCTVDGSGPSFVWNVHKHGWYVSSRVVAAVTSSSLSQHIPTPWELPTYTIWTSNVGLSWTVSVSQTALSFLLFILQHLLFVIYSNWLLFLTEM